MNKEIFLLKQEFLKIKKLGYIKTINNYTNGGGLTLEKLLNATAGNLCYPDLNGIELKTINQYWEKNINLFTDTPSSCNESTTKWLTQKFGYPDKKFKYRKIFNGKINAKSLTQIGYCYLYKLKIKKEEEKIILQIFDLELNLINEEIHWDFCFIRKKLETKLNYLALIYLEKKFIKGTQYCKYNKLKIFKLKNFDTFIEMIEKGIVEINFCTGYFKTGKREGDFHDHGTKFTINEKNIKKLFTQLYI